MAEVVCLSRSDDFDDERRSRGKRQYAATLPIGLRRSYPSALLSPPSTPLSIRSRTTHPNSPPFTPWPFSTKSIPSLLTTATVTPLNRFSSFFHSFFLFSSIFRCSFVQSFSFPILFYLAFFESNIGKSDLTTRSACLQYQSPFQVSDETK